MQSATAQTYASLQSTGHAIGDLVTGLSDESAHWSPGPGHWSIIEVLNHLADEEVEDFRARVKVLLNRPEEDFAPIDPVGWATSRRYAERRLGESLERFRTARAESLAWLESLPARDLDRSRDHPTAGPISGRQMLACWAAHDLLHVRQITRLRYQLLTQTVAPLSLGYAGKW